MFTGIIEEVGTLESITQEGARARLVVKAGRVLEGTGPGDSINIDGVCQTVTELGDGTFTVFALAETLKKTTLGALCRGDRINLERALRADSRLGGHIVQGHVGCTVPIRELTAAGNNIYLGVEIPGPFLRYCVAEGSLSLDGMSLTIAAISGCVIRVNIIPATFERTSLRYKKTGQRMNLETDIIGRYVERLLSGNAGKNQKPEASGGLRAERLRELGY
jgi:riboflavin synthase